MGTGDCLLQRKESRGRGGGPEGGSSCVCQNGDTGCSVSAANNRRVNISLWLSPLSSRPFSLKIGSSAFFLAFLLLFFDGEFLSIFCPVPAGPEQIQRPISVCLSFYLTVSLCPSPSLPPYPHPSLLKRFIYFVMKWLRWECVCFER